MSGLKEQLLKTRKNMGENRVLAHPAPIDIGWATLDAYLEYSEWGTFIKRKRCYPLDHRHGHYQLGSLKQYAEELSAFHNQGTVKAEQLLFFDTETTGLGVGAGNVPFMLGIGYYEPEQFVIEQLLIRNPAEEVAMLSYFNKLLQRFTHVVSYNGRTFDWPIVKNRFILNRLQWEQEAMLHLDFLYPSRSFWRNTLSSCRLGKVEEERLGCARINDVSGSLAPMLYFQYLAEKDPIILQGVFLHNELDILSLAGLAIHFSLALNGSLALNHMEAEEIYRIGLWLDKMGKTHLTETAFTLLLENTSAETPTYWHALAMYYKQKGDMTKAIYLWQGIIERQSLSPIMLVEPYIELAMFYEHKQRDYVRALGYAEEALKRELKRTTLTQKSFSRFISSAQDSKPKNGIGDLKKRIERLRKKNQPSLISPSKSKPILSKIITLF